ncbi:hypothetical protein EFK50_08250 [Nocardioides marmoriginsengisoli]|uniref:Bacterial spore germination immunoglobulin-like domain-containing protein n=1 Tax=Nocardioides marmoriginsengisoli TaxID=661483 RepID=A0A3N0CJU6_9ACTN|nr:Gmad2 immunoglobulin-like domain-containing protein [Nocardioides marmoriginsengisoli]RNL63715.1 hypothetical protein EFK50_08250 [Nocardioides marmoriginsengisoli]
MTDPTNDDLRQLFHETAAGIRPEGSYEEIRSRTRKVDPMARRWFLPAMAAAAVMALVVGGAFYLALDEGSKSGPAVTPDPVSTEILYAGVTAGAKAGGPENHSLFVEKHEVPALEAGKADPVAAANLAISGTPDDADYASLWPAGVSVTSAEASGTGEDRAIVVRLSGPFQERPASMSDRDQMLAINALVRTVAVAAGEPDTGVRFENAVGNGETVLGEDTLGITYFGQGDDDLATRAPVQITNLTDGQTVPPGTLTVKGVAAAFEANVGWALYVGGDAVVQSGFATAAECCVLAPYSFELKDLEPGTYTLLVHDTDESGEGLAVNQDSKEIVVQ